MLTPTVAERIRRLDVLPYGLCSRRGDHDDHFHDSRTLGTFLCTGNEDDRLPAAAERRRSAHA